VSIFDRSRQRGAGDESPSSLEADGDVEPVEGERGVSAVQRPPSLQSRLSNFLALGLMGTLGVGLLGWYYAHNLGTRSNARMAAQSSAKEKAKGEINLRPLGRVDPPVSSSPPQAYQLQEILGTRPDEPPPNTASAWPQSAGAQSQAPSPGPAGYATKTPRDLLIERQLAGPAFSASNVRTAAVESAEATQGVNPAATNGDLDSLLRPGVTKAVNAQMLPTRRLLLPKGAFIDCTLETAIDSTLAGMTTCIMATDTFSADGSVVLMERGTKLVGETRGQVRQGSTRVFVLWTEARTPAGVIVPLASPGTDELGRSGLPGKVNRHFFERFGAAILISVIDGAIQAKVQSSGNGTVIYNPSTSTDIMTEVLKSTVNIPPTVVKPQGDRIQVLVARDLDFRGVYELRPASNP
jgi:type IV secretion system protein VirB10